MKSWPGTITARAESVPPICDAARLIPAFRMTPVATVLVLAR